MIREQVGFAPDAVLPSVARADPVWLFRYSAVTFNGHRIHYDADHARKTEHQDDLLVHAPLTATLLMDLARDVDKRAIAEFSFRATAPLHGNRPFTIAANRTQHGATLHALDTEGRTAMQAIAEFVP